MGFFSSLIGWDQTMCAMNAVLASCLIEKADYSTRIKIAQEVVYIIASVKHQSQSIDLILQDISKQPRVVQMNFVALACGNLYIDPPFHNNLWSRVKNPYRTGAKLDEKYISAAVGVLKKQDGIRVTWPGNTVLVDFKKMYEDGILL